MSTVKNKGLVFGPPCTWSNCRTTHT